MQRKQSFFVVTVSLALLWPIRNVALGQSAPPASANSKQRKKIKKELSASYGPWLENDVVYIITPEERQAFLQLSTNEEREQFIESFWDRRNPDPESPVNAFKEEHYRRLVYADEHFASGIPGRKTDRGRIYIIWGRPDEIESHPMGGTYDRPTSQGGGTTTSYPWELWRYRHLEGIGENIELEFVDPSSSAEYHLAFDPCEKDAAAHVPGMGASLSEMTGQSTRAGRFSKSDGTTCPMPIGGVAARDNEFERMNVYFDNLRVDEETHKTKVSVVYRILKGQQEVWHAVETPEHIHQGGEQLTVERFIPVSTLGAGRFTIEVTAIDLLTNETVVPSAEFGVKAPAKPASPVPSL